jgi:hypothetical protein
VVLTNNGSDYRRLYATQPLHAGLVIIRGTLDYLALFGELIELRIVRSVNLG